MHIQRGFCENCGSGILSFAKEFPRLLFVKAGILNDSSWIKLSQIISWTLQVNGQNLIYLLRALKESNFMSNIKAILNPYNH